MAKALSSEDEVRKSAQLIAEEMNQGVLMQRLARR